MDELAEYIVQHAGVGIELLGHRVTISADQMYCVNNSDSPINFGSSHRSHYDASRRLAYIDVETLLAVVSGAWVDMVNKGPF